MDVGNKDRGRCHKEIFKKLQKASGTPFLFLRLLRHIFGKFAENQIGQYVENRSDILAICKVFDVPDPVAEAKEKAPWLKSDSSE